MSRTQSRRSKCSVVHAHADIHREAHVNTVLQCVAVCCSTLQCVPVCCRVLQCVAVCCSVLHRDAACCIVMRFGKVCCSVFQCYSVLHYVTNSITTQSRRSKGSVESSYANVHCEAQGDTHFSGAALRLLQRAAHVPKCRRRLGYV